LRWLKSIAVVISALLCITAVGLWLWSYMPTNLHVASNRGALVLARVYANDAAWEIYTTKSGYGVIEMTQFGDVYQHFLGFAYVSGVNGYVGEFQALAIPYWFIVLLTAIAPVTVWRRRRRQLRRRQTGQCPGCGYDLRATPDHCPECGWNRPSPPPASASATPSTDVL
jgi:hypothetical protein